GAAVDLLHRIRTEEVEQPDRVVAAAAQDLVETVASGHPIREPVTRHQERVVSGPAVKEVRARTAVDQVVAQIPLDRIVSSQPQDLVGPGAPRENIVIGRASDRVQGRARYRYRKRVNAEQSPRIGGGQSDG